MKYLLLLFVILLAGCTNEIESRHVKAGQMLCFDHDGIKEMEIDPIGSDLYICMDGVQYVIGYSSNDDGRYFITHNESDKKRNEMLDRIMMPKKWAEKDAKPKEKPKELEKIMKPASEIVEDRGL